MNLHSPFKQFRTLAAPVFALATLLGSIGSIGSAPVAVGAAGLAALSFSGSAQAVTCGSYDGKVCSGTAFQYAGGFNPNVGEAGGFGGAASCTVTHTPVIFVHGNGDNATSWDTPTFQVSGYPKAPNSVYQQFKAAGYKDCELFGVTYLTPSQRASTQSNYHQESLYGVVENFIRAVKAYTKATKVDIIGHSLGVSLSMATLTYYGDWGSVRRFINVAGGLHGLDSCLYTGYANPLVPTCGSQNIFDSNIFGFYPDSAAPGINPWTGTSATKALSNSAVQNPGTSFYTLYAGTHDEFMCATTSDYANCGSSPLLNTSGGNVKAQINVGAGSNTQQLNWDWSTGNPWNVNGGDTNGVGHFHAKNNTGTIMVKMLSTTCTTGCAVDYLYGPTQ
jgi:pimeloyl-ACP methyl ester carboxylesterase